MSCRRIKPLAPKLGESLIRTLIEQLGARIKVLNALYDSRMIGPALWQYRLRWLRADYTRIEKLAKRYGFVVK